MNHFDTLFFKARDLGLDLTKTNKGTILAFGRAPRKSDSFMLRPIEQPQGVRDSAYTLHSSLNEVGAHLDAICPQCRHYLVQREPGTPEQAHCGEWHDCRHCHFSRLDPSAALQVAMEPSATATA